MQLEYAMKNAKRIFSNNAISDFNLSISVENTSREDFACSKHKIYKHTHNLKNYVCIQLYMYVCIYIYV